ncbi:fucolectin-like [Leptodactylus fuscus]|uniref:fucolectin-like n=1 Tax=Leptodactylus fuscus TaxID=238119 RepID=UPI003F4EB824
MRTYLGILRLLVLGGLKYDVYVESLAVNLPLQCLAFQSSSIPGQGEAHLAIDGNTNTDFLKGSCSQTTSEYQPWWTVDLRRGYVVANVTITSQLVTTSSLSNQIPWAEIHVGESLENYGVSNPSCSVISSMKPGTTVTFPCGGIIGRYVTVVIPNRIDSLTLCEVQVAALDIPDQKIRLAVRGESTSAANLQQNTKTIIKLLRPKVKMDIGILTWGIDNVLQRDNHTCIPMK